MPLTLPAGWRAHAPEAEHLAELLALRARHEVAVRGRTSAGVADVESEVVGPGARARSHLAVRDADGVLRAWATVQDRATGRLVVAVLVDPDLAAADADGLATALFAWVEDTASRIARDRGTNPVQLDSGAFEPDLRQQRWLTAAGYAHARTWWQMSRPVVDDDLRPAREPGPGVRIRPVGRSEEGMPDEADLVAVHHLLEQAFADHFNHHEETFEQFVGRLRADPGHRWDHWWLGEVVDGPRPEPAGALVASAMLDAQGRTVGSYVEYLGVLRTARGRGLATSLLDAVITDAAARGRAAVGLEVDADSPTGAAELYRSLGFVTGYVTQSWHRDLALHP